MSPQCPHLNQMPKWFSRGGLRESWNCRSDHQSAIGSPYYQFDRLLSPANQVHKRTLPERPRLLAIGEHKPLVFSQTIWPTGHWPGCNIIWPRTSTKVLVDFPPFKTFDVDHRYFDGLSVKQVCSSGTRSVLHRRPVSGKNRADLRNSSCRLLNTRLATR